MSADGDWTLITEYTGTFYVHVIDTRNPRVPLLASTITLGSAGHTSECLDKDCNWVYGSEGQILDLPRQVPPRPARSRSGRTCSTSPTATPSTSTPPAWPRSTRRR